MAGPHAWLMLLSCHPVFTENLPTAPPSSSASSQKDNAISPGPNAAALSRGRRSTQPSATASDSLGVSIQEITEQLAALRNPAWEADGYGRLTTRAVALRGHDLFVVVRGIQIRVVSLKRLKDIWLEAQTASRTTASSDDDHSDNDGGHLKNAAGSEEDADAKTRRLAAQVPYQILDANLPGFAIRTVRVNDDGRYMVVQGRYHVYVVGLPRPGSTSRGRSGRLACKSFAVGSDLYSPRFAAYVADVQWHPLSAGQNHLMVLSSDGVLRMFNVMTSLDHPEQVQHFGPDEGHPAPRTGSGKASRAGSFFAFGSDLETHEAVAFCLGHRPGLPDVGEATHQSLSTAVSPRADRPAWAALTVYVLMRNGDIYSLAPYLPLDCVVPSSFLDDLSLSIRTLFETQSELTDVDSYGRYVSTAGATTPVSHPTQLLHTRQWLAKLQDTAVTISQRPQGRSHRQGAGNGGGNDDGDLIRISWPGFPLAPRPIGPYLLQPAPPELSGDDAPVACDIHCLDLHPTTVVAVAYRHGQVDLLLQMQPLVPRWGSLTTASATTFAVSAAAPTGVSDEAFLLGNRLPVLVAYESIDLGLDPPRPAIPAEAPKRSVRPGSVGNAAEDDDDRDNDEGSQSIGHGEDVILVSDPLYAGTFYCYHRQGAQAVDVEKWYALLSKVLLAEADRDQPGNPTVLESPTRPSGGPESHAGLADENPAAAASESKRQAEARHCIANRTLASEVTWVVNTKPLPTSTALPVVGLLVIEDAYLAYALGLLTLDGNFVGVELTIRYTPGVTDDQVTAGATTTKADGVEPSDPTRKALVATLGGPAGKDPKAGGETDYVPQLPLPAYTVPAEVMKLVNSPAPTFVGRAGSPSDTFAGQTPTEAAAKYMGDSVMRLRNHVATLVKAQVEMKEHIGLQLTEHDRQANILIRQTAELTDGLIPRHAASVARADELRVRQQDLHLRYDRLLRKLIELNQPVLTPEEREYLTELKRMEKLIRAGDGLDQSVTALRAQMDRIKRAYAVPSTSAFGSATAENHRSRSRAPSYSTPPPHASFQVSGTGGLNRGTQPTTAAYVMSPPPRPGAGGFFTATTSDLVSRLAHDPSSITSQLASDVGHGLNEADSPSFLAAYARAIYNPNASSSSSSLLLGYHSSSTIDPSVLGSGRRGIAPEEILTGVQNDLEREQNLIKSACAKAEALEQRVRSVLTG